MSEIKDQSLDDTLKELLQQEETKPVKNTGDKSAEKPKRKRRTKAQIEADKKAAEEAAKFTVEEATALMTEPEEVIIPEVIPDTAEDLMDDVVESTEEVSQPEPEVFQPELVLDNEADAQPDVVEEKEPPKPRQKPAPGEIFEALKAKKDVEPISKYIGKHCVLFALTPTYRAPHVSTRMKPYKGFVTVIEDPKNGFVKVQFLRQGFGLCTAYMDAETIINLIGGDENVVVQQE